MTSGYRSGGLDFDDLFDPYVTGAKSIDTGLRVAGVDLSQRYAHISLGSKRADVGYRINGVDVSNLWAAKGTAVYSLAFQGVTYAAASQALTTETGTVNASCTVVFNANGTWTMGGAGKVVTGTPTTGTWLPADGTASQWQVMYGGATTWDSGSGTVTNGAPSYATVAGQSFTISASALANSVQHNKGHHVLVVNLRNTVTGQIITTTCSFNVDAQGWQ